MDLDATDDPIHGQQAGQFFHGCYRHDCYLPMYIFSGSITASAPGSNRVPISKRPSGSLEPLDRVVGRIRQSWPEVSIVIRADSGFCRDDLLRWCEDHHVDYVMGMANNDRLKSESAEAMTQVRSRVQRHRATGAGLQGFPLPDSPQLDLGSTRRRQGRVPGQRLQFPVQSYTCLSPERLGARAIYEDFYCARGDMENLIPQQQIGLYRRPDQRGNDARQSTPAVSVLRRQHDHASPCRSSRTPDRPPWLALRCQTMRPTTPQDRRPVFASTVGSTSGSPCRKPITTARSSLPSIETSSPFLCAAEVCLDQHAPKNEIVPSHQAELCLNTFRHARPNPKNAPFTTIHTTASLEMDRIR